jgi:hypothetical protein
MANRGLVPDFFHFVGQAFPPADQIKMASDALALQIRHPDAT